MSAKISPGRKHKRPARLQDEIDARLEALQATEDNIGVSVGDLEKTALQDIAEMSADDHGCQTPSETRAWNRMRRWAQIELARIDGDET